MRPWNKQDEDDLQTLSAIVQFAVSAMIATLVAGLVYAAAAQDDVQLYRNNGQRFGLVHRQLVDDTTISFDAKLSAYYYDAALVYNQLAAMTGDESYYTYAEKWARFFAEQYVLPANGNIPGFWNFTTGMRRAYERSGLPSLRGAVVAISQNGAYVRDSTSEDTTSTLLSREVAYAIRALIDAAAMGAPRQYRLDKLTADAKSHLRQWCVTQTAPYVRPFMVALTIEALVYAGQAESARSEVEACANYIWTHNWDESAGGFRYTDRSIGNPDDLEVQPDLNMLIYPVYGWLRWQAQKTKILQGGVMRTDSSGNFHVGGAYLFGVKQFNQNYRSAIPYLAFTTIPTITPSLTPTPTPIPSPTPTATLIPSPIPTPCRRPSRLTLRYHQCRIDRIEKIIGLTEQE